MFTEILSEQAQGVLAALKPKILRAGKWYMAGGTALALHYGHRRSEDFDFFCKKSFDSRKIIDDLIEKGKTSVEQLETETLSFNFHGIKFSFFGYHYPLLRRVKNFDKLSIAHPLDIACMKLTAILGRGSKKDFFDIYWLLQHFKLATIFKAMARKYTPVKIDSLLYIKALNYFEDADGDPDPIVLKGERNWNPIKAYIINKTKNYLKDSD